MSFLWYMMMMMVFVCCEKEAYVLLCAGRVRERLRVGEGERAREEREICGNCPNSPFPRNQGLFSSCLNESSS